MMNLLKYLIFIIVLVAVPAVSAAPTIDGDPSEWGPAGFLTGDWTYNDTWLPYSNVTFIVEDNRNPNFGGDYTGVHIKGRGSSYSFYDEPKVTLKNGAEIAEPYQGEQYDLEAIYFQQDDEYVYILVVTSLPEDGLPRVVKAPGDLRIDITDAKSTDGYIYEMGVKLGTKTLYGGLEQWGLYNVTKWNDGADLIIENRPAVIEEGNLLAKVQGAYVDCVSCNGSGMDEGYKNYIIEMRISKEDLGIGTGNTAHFDDFSLTDFCTNDLVHIPVPEFGTIVLPIAGILGLVFVLKRRKGR